MNKTPEEKAEATIVWVLNQLQEQIALQKYTDKLIVITIDIEEWKNQSSDSPPISDIRYVILKMARKWDILEIVDKTGVDKSKIEHDWNKSVYFVLEIKRRKFEKFVDHYYPNKDKKVTSELINNMISSVAGRYEKKLIRKLREKDFTVKEMGDIGAKDIPHLISNTNKNIEKQGFQIKITDKKNTDGLRKYHLSTP